MNRFYNHIKHLVDNKDQIKNIRRRRQVDKYDATGILNLIITNIICRSLVPWVEPKVRFNFQEHLEDLEHQQARHQGIYGGGRGETY